MIFTEDNKRIELNISGYQFPNRKSTRAKYDEDANWLVCEIKYSEDNFSRTYWDACLLTDELEELTHSLSNILEGLKSEYISEFVEPNFHISIAKEEDKIKFLIHYAYDISAEIWKKRKVTSFVEEDYAIQILNNLRTLQEKYPRR